MNPRLKRKLSDFTFILPVLAVFTIFVIIPFIQGFPLSFTDWDGLNNDSNWVGLDNYIKMFSDSHVANAYKNTFVFSIITVVFSNVLGLAVAMLISKTNRLNNTIRTLIFLPFCLSMLLQSFIWKYLYQDVFYGLFGISNPLTNINLVMIGLSIICIWADTGYCMVIYIAALQGIPKDYYEAAEIEGCSKWNQFLNITLPMLGPAITANVTIYLGWGMKVYDYPMAATNGGPGRASETIAVLIYKNLFGYFKAGYGQAVAIVFTIVIFIVSGLTAYFLRKREVEV
ncbi:carbohydrate ABC transporter permease [Youxingia wuxianensis]|uniref:Sugar ABC transporter permease n=1 Tax=Youxingia wuxianensis TaxID=2763678 RepID=A0A926EKK0_9FIRM|nr:sugar ABC transporter permease [Youxingia wuxianensis]MBC8585093.1 sugar ABC transporter permease [Youxingia wuxianensis]